MAVKTSKRRDQMVRGLLNNVAAPAPVCAEMAKDDANAPKTHSTFAGFKTRSTESERRERAAANGNNRRHVNLLKRNAEARRLNNW